MEPEADTNTARQNWQRTLALADHGELAELLQTLPAREPTDAPDGELDIAEIRPAEVGTALVAARVGATGMPFGAGEITITRCAVEINGCVGVGYVRGRAPAHARRVALVDALLQGTGHELVMQHIVAPLERAHRARSRVKARTVATSRVDFVTMVRGD